MPAASTSGTAPDRPADPMTKPRITTIGHINRSTPQNQLEAAYSLPCGGLAAIRAKNEAEQAARADDEAAHE